MVERERHADAVGAEFTGDVEKIIEGLFHRPNGRIKAVFPQIGMDGARVGQLAQQVLAAFVEKPFE